MPITGEQIVEIIGADKLAEHSLKSMAAGRASATPLPGPLASAFTAGDIKAGEYSVRRIVLADWRIFDIVDSPLVRMMLELQKPEKEQEQVVTTADEDAMLCYQFTRPAREVYERLTKDGKAVVIEQAKDIFLFGDGDSTTVITNAIMEQFGRHMKTRLEYATQQKESGEISFLSPTPTPTQTG